MTPQQMESIGKRLYGPVHWRAQLALNIGVNVTTIWRKSKFEKIPYLWEVAIRGLAEHHRTDRKLRKKERECLRMLGLWRPRLRKKATARQAKKIKAPAETGLKKYQKKAILYFPPDK